MTANRVAARAVGRSVGAIFFSAFGSGWLLLSSVYFHHFRVLLALADVAVLLLAVWLARRLARRGKAASEDAFPAAERQLNDRRFGWINAVTWVMVLLLFVILPRFGLSNYIFPAFVGLVGLHFFPMPPLYRHRANLVTGGALVACALVCTLLYHADGYRLAATVMLGAGLILWCSAAWALHVSATLLRSQGL